MSDQPVILQVEDDPNDVLLLQRAFKKVGIDAELRVVPDGEELIRYLNGAGAFRDRARFPLPSLVLLDIKLPRSSGLDVLRWMRSQPGGWRVPVVMLTSSKQPLDVDRCYEAGASGYIVKSIDFESLVRSLRAVDDFWMKSNIVPPTNGHARFADGDGARPQPAGTPGAQPHFHPANDALPSGD